MLMVFRWGLVVVLNLLMRNVNKMNALTGNWMKRCLSVANYNYTIKKTKQKISYVTWASVSVNMPC